MRVVAVPTPSGAAPPVPAPSAPGAAAPAPPPPPPEDVGFRTQLGQGAGGGQCVGLANVVGPGEASSLQTSQAEATFLRLIATMPQCTNPDGTAAVAAAPGAATVIIVTTPAIEAARFWQAMPLPDLAPRIGPGTALVGWGTFLETGGEPVASAGGPTPFGPLAITATRTVTVDWDDGAGSVTGPHEGIGGPWPDGDITWAYQVSGPRNITVTQTWTATWSIGAASGTFEGRGTTATIADFPVDQVQAVRTR